MISRSGWILIGVVAVVIAAIIVLGWDFLHGTLELLPRAIGYLGAILGIAAVVAILWWATLRDWSRKPGKRGRQ